MSKKCVLAYSGGLDTSVILGWLLDKGYEVHAVYVDLGQPCEDREEIRKKAENIGASSVRFIDVKEEVSATSPSRRFNGKRNTKASTSSARRSLAR